MMIRIPTNARLVTDEETERLLERIKNIKFAPKNGFLVERVVRRKRRK